MGVDVKLVRPELDLLHFSIAMVAVRRLRNNRFHEYDSDYVGLAIYSLTAMRERWYVANVGLKEV